MTSGEAVKNELKVAIPSEYSYKQPSSNERISYILVSLVNHDGDPLDCGHYVSNFLDSSTGIWWHFDDENITQISDLPQGVYYRETNKHMKNKNKTMAGSTGVLFVVYIRTSHLKNIVLIFQELTIMPKTTHMKKVIEDHYVFRSDFKVRQEVNNGIKTSIYYIKDELQNPIEKNILGKARN